MFIDSSVFIESVGFASVTVESALAIPQVLRNQKKKSTLGVSTVLIASWFLGDTIKLGYFVLKNQPLQFILCAVVQILIDVVLVYQFYAYAPTVRKHDQTD